MSSEIEIKIPDIGDFADVEVIELLVAPGDSVQIEDPLLSLESDKAAMEVPSPHSGVIRDLRVSVGDRVSEGTVVAILTVEDQSEGSQTESPAAPVEESGAETSEVTADDAQIDENPGVKPTGAMHTAHHEPPASLPPPVQKSGDSVPHASPGIRRFARELGADLTQIHGSGPKGRILKEDIKNWIKQRLSAPIPASSSGPALGIPPIPEVDFSRFGETETVPLGRIQKLSGQHLQRAWLNIPHVTQHDEADITELEAFRRSLKEETAQEGVRVTLLGFVLKILVGALKKFPRFNASLNPGGESLTLKRYFHIGVAVDTPDGLVVPVIRDVDQKTILELARELGEISEKARNGKLTPADMQGGCISVSSLGGIGGTAFTPIVNAPEVAILGLSRSRFSPVWNQDEGSFQPRLMLPLSLSYDHRVIDGAEAARFCAYLTRTLADMRRTLL